MPFRRMLVRNLAVEAEEATWVERLVEGLVKQAEISSSSAFSAFWLRCRATEVH